MASERHDTPVADQQPRPPFPKQHQRSPGIESKLDPRPRYVFLASNADSSYVTGIILPVMGGETSGG